MKKILFIDTGYEFGGGTKSLLYLLEGLLKYKDNYSLYIFFENNYKINDTLYIVDYLQSLGINIVNYKSNYTKLSKIKREIYRIVSKTFLYKQEFKNKLSFVYDILSSDNFDLVHLNNHFGTNLEYIQVANKLNIPVIQHLRKNSLLNYYQIKLLKSLKFYTISVSKSTYQFYNRQIAIDDCVIYNPFPIEVNKNELKNEQNSDIIKILMPANYLENKGHKLVFQAINKLNRDDIVLYLAGSGKFNRETEILKQKLINENKVIELGFVKDITKYYMETDYVLSFSQNEGLPRVVIEGLIYGCSIITSDYDVSFEIKSLVEKQNRYIIIQRDINKLTYILSSLIKVYNRKFDKQISDIFSIEQYLYLINQLYKKIL